MLCRLYGKHVQCWYCPLSIQKARLWTFYYCQFWIIFKRVVKFLKFKRKINKSPKIFPCRSLIRACYVEVSSKNMVRASTIIRNCRVIKMIFKNISPNLKNHNFTCPAKRRALGEPWPQKVQMVKKLFTMLTQNFPEWAIFKGMFLSIYFGNFVYELQCHNGMDCCYPHQQTINPFKNFGHSRSVL